MTIKTRNKPRMRNATITATPGVAVGAIAAKARSAVDAKAPSELEGFRRFTRELCGLDPQTGAILTDSELSSRGISPQSWGDVENVRHLRDALEGITFQVMEEVRTAEGIRLRAVDTSAFALVTSALSVREVARGYEDVPTIAQELVEEMDDTKKISFIANALHEDHNIKEVPEGKDFPLVGGGEEKFTVGHRRNGRMIVLSAELFEENNKGEIISRLTNLGKLAAELIEEVSLEKITDHYGSGSSPAAPYLLNMDGGKAFFQTSASTLTRLGSSGNRLTNTPLNDETSFTAARLMLAAQKNGRGKRIAFPREMLVTLVPDALHDLAFKLLNSEYVPGTVNEINPWGPRGEHRPRLLSSPKLDDLSTSAWYFGAPRWSLRRKWKLRPETVMHGGMSGSFLPFVNSREGIRVRTAWDFEIGAADYVGWIQALAAETAPVDA